jgi:hypothetical protein
MQKKLLHRLNLWEAYLKRRPQRLIRLLSLVFIGSLLAGISSAFAIRSMKTQLIKESLSELHEQESQRMQGRVETLQQIHFAPQ